MALNLNCSESRNRIFIVSGVSQIEIGIDHSTALKIDSYIRYRRDYDDVTGYIKYIVKERVIDEFENIILICDEEACKFN